MESWHGLCSFLMYRARAKIYDIFCHHLCEFIWARALRRKERLMKVVLTIWENRISPVADSARQLLVVDVKDRSVRNRRIECLDAPSVFHSARTLADLNAKIFICGAISDFFATLVEGYGIHVIPFVCGQADEVLNAYLEDNLSNPRFAMTEALGY